MLPKKENVKSGKFDSLQGPSDASEEARYRFLLKWRGSPMLQMVDGNAKWIYQPPRWRFPPRVPNRIVKRLESVFVECGLCEAHVEGSLSSNSVMRLCCFIYTGCFLVAIAKWLVTYELYIILCTFS